MKVFCNLKDGKKSVIDCDDFYSYEDRSDSIEIDGEQFSLFVIVYGDKDKHSRVAHILDFEVM